MKCGKCGFDIPVPYRTWNMKTFAGETMLASAYVCPKCRHTFRVITKPER